MINANFGGLRGGNCCVSKAVLAEGTNANTFKTTATLEYAIDGVMYSKAATDNLAFSTGTTIAAGKQCMFGVWIDSAGALTTTQGRIITTADLTAGTDVLEWPVPVANKAFVGGIRVRCDNAATFIPGSTDLGATDVVDTYFDCFNLPVKPLIS